MTAAEQGGYVLVCLERSALRGRAVWWRPEERGYTDKLEEAGRYTLDRTLELARIGRGDALPVPLSIATLYSAVLW